MATLNEDMQNLQEATNNLWLEVVTLLQPVVDWLDNRWPFKAEAEGKE